MRELCANLAAVNVLRQFQDIAQLHACITGPGKTTRIKLAVHVTFGQTQVVQFENARNWALHQTQRINVRYLVTAQAVNLNKAGNCGLFFARSRGPAWRPGRDQATLAALSSLKTQIPANRRMCDFGFRVA